jgi:hypothetical protein
MCPSQYSNALRNLILFEKGVWGVTRKRKIKNNEEGQIYRKVRVRE